MENKEIWKDIEGYEGLYQISNMGRVKSLKFGKERILSICKRNKNYCSVSLCKNKITKSFSIHRLVASAFIPNPDNLPIINHKDENPTNNRVENLEWCNHKYNMNYGNINKKRSDSLLKNSPLKLCILQFNKEGEFIKKWQSSMDIQRELNINHSNINKCCNNKIHYNTVSGYKWGYEKDYEQIKFDVFDITLYRKKAA